MAPTDRFRARKQPRQQRSAQTRRDILDAAARVFGEHGYAAGTTLLAERLRDTEARGVAGVAELLRRHPEVRVTDPEFAARLTIATVESLVHRLIVAPVDPAQLEDEVVRLPTGYLTANAAVPAAAPPPA